jgi:hypothetical protein
MRDKILPTARPKNPINHWRVLLPVSTPESIYKRVVVIKQQIAFLSSQRPWA